MNLSAGGLENQDDSRKSNQVKKAGLNQILGFQGISSALLSNTIFLDRTKR